MALVLYTLFFFTRNMFKRGQITVFIIIGIVVLFIMVALLSTYSTISLKKTTVSEEGVLDASNIAGPIKSYVESCLEKTTQEAIFENGLKGGYFQLPERSTTEYLDNLPYYVSLGESLIPNQETLEQEIQNYTNYFLYRCLKFDSFKQEGYNISYVAPQTKIIIKPKKIMVTLDMLVEIQRDAFITQISKFVVVIPNDQLYADFQSVINVLNESQRGMFCLSCIATEGKKNNHTFVINSLGNNTHIIRVVDNDYVFYLEPYILNFVVNYG